MDLAFAHTLVKVTVSDSGLLLLCSGLSSIN